MTRNRVGKIPAFVAPVTFEVGKGFVTAMIHIENSTIGLRFESPEQLLSFFSELMENAVIAWPNNEWIKYYVQDEQ